MPADGSAVEVRVDVRHVPIKPDSGERNVRTAVVLVFVSEYAP